MSIETMKDFETWFSELTSDQIWFEPASMHHKPETFKACARKVYMQGVAEGIFKPVQEARKHVYNIICKTPGDRPKGKPWHEIALEKKLQEDANKEEWQPASKEFADQKAAEALEIIRNSKTLNYFPRVSYKESIEEGGWLPKKQAPYPHTSPMEAYVKERHIAYLLANYDARTREPLPDWQPEEEWNIAYDEKNL